MNDREIYHFQVINSNYSIGYMVPISFVFSCSNIINSVLKGTLRSGLSYSIMRLYEHEEGNGRNDMREKED